METNNKTKALKWWCDLFTIEKIQFMSRYFGSEMTLSIISEDDIAYIWENETLNMKNIEPTPIYKNEKILDEMEAFLKGTTPENILEKCKEFGITVNDVIEEEPKSMNFIEELKHYFATTPIEQVLKDWEETAEYDQAIMCIDEPIEVNEYKYVWLNPNSGVFSNSWSTEANEKWMDNDTIKRATDDHWKLIKYQCLNVPEFEFNNLMKLK